MIPVDDGTFYESFNSRTDDDNQSNDWKCYVKWAFHPFVRSHNFFFFFLIFCFCALWWGNMDTDISTTQFRASGVEFHTQMNGDSDNRKSLRSIKIHDALNTCNNWIKRYETFGRLALTKLSKQIFIRIRHFEDERMKRENFCAESRTLVCSHVWVSFGPFYFSAFKSNSKCQNQIDQNGRALVQSM